MWYKIRTLNYTFAGVQGFSAAECLRERAVSFVEAESETVEMRFKGHAPAAIPAVLRTSLTGKSGLPAWSVFNSEDVCIIVSQSSGLSGSGLGFASWAWSVAGFRAEFEKELE